MDSTLSKRLNGGRGGEGPRTVILGLASRLIGVGNLLFKDDLALPSARPATLGRLPFRHDGSPHSRVRCGRLLGPRGSTNIQVQATLQLQDVDIQAGLIFQARKMESRSFCVVVLNDTSELDIVRL